jgi:hypothetical protein
MSRRYAWPLLAAFVAILLQHPTLLYALQGTTVVDRTGLLGPVIDKFWPVIVTFLTSLTVKIVAKVSDGFAKTSEPVKWAALYGFALLYNIAAKWLDIAAVDPTAPLFSLSAVQMVAAALVYKFGQHKVPVVESPATSAPSYPSR